MHFDNALQMSEYIELYNYVVFNKVVNLKKWQSRKLLFYSQLQFHKDKMGVFNIFILRLHYPKMGTSSPKFCIF